MSDRVPADRSSGEVWALQSMLVDAAEEHREEIERVARAIVDVLDSLDRLLRDENSLQSWRLITRQFVSALNGSGLDVIGWVGEMAEPHTHRVIETRHTTEVADDVVLEVLRRGYRYRGRVVRPAEVIVANNPAQSTDATEQCTDQEQG